MVPAVPRSSRLTHDLLTHSYPCEAARSLHERVGTDGTGRGAPLRCRLNKTSISHRACSPASIASVLFPFVVENNPKEEKKITMALLLILIAVCGSWPW
jgi:hypothetical protein